MTDSVSFGGRSRHSRCFHRRLRLSRPSATVCEPPNVFRFFLVPPSLENFRASSPLFDDETSRPVFHAQYFNQDTGKLHEARNLVGRCALAAWRDAHGKLVLDEDAREALGHRCGGMFTTLLYRKQHDGTYANRCTLRTQLRFKHLRIEAADDAARDR